MKNLVLIKLGGSLITDKKKPFTAKPDVIQRLAGEIKRAGIGMNIILGHGQGSFAHILAAKYQTQLGIVNDKSVFGMAKVSEMAKRPNTIVTQIFLELGVPVVSFSPMSFIYTKDKKPSRLLTESIEKALKLNMLPVIYGDVIFDDAKRGFCIYSTETVLDLLAGELSGRFNITRIIMAGDTDGVYDTNGKTIRNITVNSFPRVKKAITGSESTDVTGGMIHKVEKSLELASEKGVETLIINGNTKGELEKAILSDNVKGTVIRK